jgi:hypothetical protein
MYVSSSIAYCYHSANVISSGLAQSDPIKWCLLYITFKQQFQRKIVYQSTATIKKINIKIKLKLTENLPMS